MALLSCKAMCLVGMRACMIMFATLLASRYLIGGFFPAEGGVVYYAGLLVRLVVLCMRPG